MGTPVSEGDDITRLSLELEGLRISITRTRGSGRPVSLSSAESLSGFSLVSEAAPSSPPADQVLGVASAGSLGRSPNPQTLSPVRSPEPRAAIEASFPPLPQFG